MKIELKNIHYSPTLSDDSNAFTANLYVEGKNVCTASDRGNGGGIWFSQVDPKYKSLLKSAEEWCKGLPPLIEQHPLEPKRPYVFNMSLELYVDQLLGSYLKAKEEQKMERRMIKGLLLGRPGLSYREIQFKKTMDQIMAQPNGHKIMASTIKKYVLPELKEGVIFLNTNIPEEIIKDSGLKEGQYVTPKPIVDVQRKPNQKKGPTR